MKFLNGQVCKKPYRKVLLILGSILSGVGVLVFFMFFAGSDWGDSKDLLAVAIVYGGMLMIPGIILLTIGLVKRAKNIREYQEMLNMNYEAWRSEHLNNPNDPLFSVNCNRCGGLIEYDFKGIDGTRAWFPNGYIVCPKCNAIMRHNANKQA